MYTLSDIKQIQKTTKHVLPSETLNIIAKISKLIGVETQIPMFKIEKVLTISQQITILLNKMTEDNYKEIESKLIKLIDTNPTEIENSTTIIFDIISNNAFYGSIYASLYISLVKQWSIFKDLFQVRLTQHMEQLKNIQLVPSSEYDEFCKCNEINERYRTFSQFIVHLTLQGIVDNTTFHTFLNYLIDLLHAINKSKDKSTMDEIVEHLYLCIIKSKPIHSKLFISRDRLHIRDVSNKVKFRLMDILDII
jgi:hypothetical protein